jgi:hypothetical protein
MGSTVVLEEKLLERENLAGETFQLASQLSLGATSNSRPLTHHKRSSKEGAQDSHMH